MTAVEVKKAFETFGDVSSTKIIIDKDSGESKGFGFVEMFNQIEAQAAINGITKIRGKRVKIEVVRSKP